MNEEDSAKFVTAMYPLQALVPISFCTGVVDWWRMGEVKEMLGGAVAMVVAVPEIRLVKEVLDHILGILARMLVMATDVGSGGSRGWSSAGAAVIRLRVRVVACLSLLGQYGLAVVVRKVGAR